MGDWVQRGNTAAVVGWLGYSLELLRGLTWCNNWGQDMSIRISPVQN
jgi:hypothetical protein